MDWSDDGIVLSARPHGENAAIVTLLTRDHGRHAGLVRGGSGRRGKSVYQTGNRVRANWRARLEEHLGSYTCELTNAHAATLMAERLPLAALTSAAALVDAALPEREPHPAVFNDFLTLVDALGEDGWAVAYIRWEAALLADLGFGLDLSACAVTGEVENLAWVSPKTGRAVSVAAGKPYERRLLPLPGFLWNDDPPTPDDLLAGLKLTGHFLGSHVFSPQNRPVPPSRLRLVDGIVRLTTTSGNSS